MKRPKHPKECCLEHISEGYAKLEKYATHLEEILKLAGIDPEE